MMAARSTTLLDPFCTIKAIRMPSGATLRSVTLPGRAEVLTEVVWPLTGTILGHPQVMVTVPAERGHARSDLFHRGQLRRPAGSRPGEQFPGVRGVARDVLSGAGMDRVGTFPSPHVGRVATVAEPRTETTGPTWPRWTLASAAQRDHTMTC